MRVSGLDLHSCSPEPINFFGEQSSLGGHEESFGGHKQSFGGHGPGMSPPVAPGLIRLIFRIWLDSRRFVDEFSKTIKIQVVIEIIPIYKSFKVKSYFELKSRTSVALCSKVVYQFTCSCNTNKTYIGMSSGQLSTRVQEHLQ